MSHKSDAVNQTLKLPQGREFEARLQQLISDEKDFVVAMLDVDSFLTVNTEFGYDVGDEVLIKTGQHFLKWVTDGVEFYRYGGDEFAMLFLNAEKEEVFLKMEKARSEYNVVLPSGVRQTVSIGIAAALEDAATPGEIVRKAEGAMFRAKSNGRDRVCLAREEKMVTKTAHYTVEQLKRLTKISQREGIGEAILLREALDALLKKYDV